MLHAALALLVLGIAPAMAGDDETEQGEIVPHAERQAEYNRLAEEMQKLAGRNAWAGVERFYAQLEATEVPIEFDELITGAHSARAVGNTKLSRDRLSAANKLKEERDVIEWLWELDEAYGTTTLFCDPEWKRRPELAAEAVPFDPNQARSVQFAIKTIAETCEFDGMLPGGKYTFGQYEFEVKPKVESVRIDMRGEPEPKTKKNK